MKRQLMFLILLFILIAHLSFRIWGYRQEFLTKYDPIFWRDKYLKSQWVNPESKEPIGDDGLYAYAGWEYINGKDPTILNAEMPPLGKYLIGLSILIFGNQNIFSLASGVLVLFAFYKLNLIILKEKFWALLPVVFFSLEPLYYQQLRAPYLDNLYLLFLLFSFYFSLKEKFFTSALFLGLMASTKNSFSTFFLVGGTAVLYLLLTKRSALLVFFKSLLMAVFVFLLVYSRYFFLGHSFRDFLGVQKWVLNFYAVGAKGTLGMIFPMVFLNQWKTWWDGIVRIEEWQITWPILFLFTIFYFLFTFFRKKTDQFPLILIWVVDYTGFLVFIPVWPRYFLLILPFLYLLSVDLVRERLGNIIQRHLPTV